MLKLRWHHLWIFLSLICLQGYVNAQDWIVSPLNNHSYKVISRGTLQDCRAQAISEGAYLVTINDAAEQRWLIDTFGGDAWFWIGYTDEVEEGVWRWTNGEAAAFTNWAAFEPNDFGGCEDYAMMNWTQPGLWNDLGPCSGAWEQVTQAIIERDNSVAQVIWSDDFEGIALGRFPAPLWTSSGNPEAFIDDTVSVSGRQSFYLEGILGGYWGAAAHRPLEVSAPFEISFHILTGNESLSGCHASYGGVELSAGPSWTFAHRGLIRFTGTGEIRGGAFEADEGDGVFLTAFVPGVWYHVRIRYEVVDAATVRLNFWIDEVWYGQHDFPARTAELGFSHLGLWGGEGRVWYDDVRVLGQRDEGPFAWPVRPDDRGEISQDYAHFDLGRPNAYHGGLDIAAARGAAVHPTTPGHVIQIVENDIGCVQAQGGCEDQGFGNTMILEHIYQGTTVYSQYAHLDTMNGALIQACGPVDVGQRRTHTCAVPVSVDLGTQLGTVGSSAFGSNSEVGVNLHFETKSFSALHEGSFGYTATHPDLHGYYDPVLLLHEIMNDALPSRIRVNASALNLRLGPGGHMDTAYRPLNVVSTGQEYEVLNATGGTTTPRCPGGWYQIRPDNGVRFRDTTGGGELPEGWVCLDFVVPVIGP